MTETDPRNGPGPTEPLEVSLEAVERHLGALGIALRDRDAAGVERHAAELHRALATAMHRFTHASRQSRGVPPALRQRLALAGGQVAAQRESLARATAALDRAIEVLLPQAAPAAVYGHAGQSGRAPAGHGLQA
jgi:hypothetical protein